MENVNKQLLDVAEKLKKAGATVPAPQAGGTIESAMRHGLSIALAVVEDAIAAAEQAQQGEPVALGDTELLTKWEEAYRAFIGAFDTLIARRRMGDEYSSDARDRLFQFDRAFRNAVAQPPAVAVAVPDEMESVHDTPFMSADTEPEIAYRDGWNACRAAMLAAMGQPK